MSVRVTDASAFVAHQAVKKRVDAPARIGVFLFLFIAKRLLLVAAAEVESARCPQPTACVFCVGV